MQLKRVVVTGMGAISPYGSGVAALQAGIAGMESAITRMERASEIRELRSQIAGLIPDIDVTVVPRKDRRTMTAMGIYALMAAREALSMAGLGDEDLGSGRLGVSLACTSTCGDLLEEFFSGYLPDRDVSHCKSTTFFKLMNHALASSVAQALNVCGRIISPASACATSTQAIGYGYEAIQLGRQDIMLCGGSEELHPLSLASFDLINAASTGFNDAPTRAPRPFDRDRDGVVCAEGAGLLILESYDHAVARGATILGELVGFSTSSSPKHPANPDAEAILRCMEEALHDAGLMPSQIDYLNAHATGTVSGDAAEAQAIRTLFGSELPVSSFKGHMGHTLAASGVLETIATFSGLQSNTLYPTRNLEAIDPDCVGINLFSHALTQSVTYFIKNSFALGGINASLVFRRI